jgi:hypothetical protein
MEPVDLLPCTQDPFTGYTPYMTPVDVITLYFFKIDYKITLPSALTSSKFCLRV